MTNTPYEQIFKEASFKPTLRRNDRTAVTVKIPVSLLKEDVVYLIAYGLDRGQIPRTKVDVFNLLHIDNAAQIINHSASLDNEDSVLEQAEPIFNKIFPEWRE